MKLLILNGANINMLGIREPDIYGRQSFQNLIDSVQAHADEKGVQVEFYQSNHEGDLVDAIQKAYFDGYDGIVINPGAYTHTSIAILDAVKATSIPTVEVHISKLEERESFRQISYIRKACIKSIIGEGTDGYLHAVDELVRYCREEKK